ncbi:NRDE family protein [Aureibacter tunicatorum]|uniref:Transport and Golgi organization protein 2 n=1 Tax=Aureibacter tunicatorum TaxID=866807 RepID=A0AAE3XNC1_9BACT|nr:NRDE family protein [Aureibacter tunicatorum]MDR6239748.1 hypothetical protein [Aureibacter tunicatorum]BDD04224.1 hypothetical protein AUTU_17070 [Aureibacter tunicatorum]
MCTATFFALENGEFALTHNRDESYRRAIAVLPKEKTIDGKKIIVPIDPQGKGSWIFTSIDLSVCLLNGAFEKHEKRDDYVRSRGTVVLEVLETSTDREFIDTVDLNGVEPFTLILFRHSNQSSLGEFRWDGKEKYYKELALNENHIWSSVTLYDELAQFKRIKAFEKQFSGHIPSKDEIMKFHLSMHNPDIFMKTETHQTVSTSQMIVGDAFSTFEYADYINDVKTKLAL